MKHRLRAARGREEKRPTGCAAATAEQHSDLVNIVLLNTQSIDHKLFLLCI